MRMERTRLPRMLAFAKVRHVRRIGGQLLTYGKRLIGEVRLATAAAKPEVRRRIEGRRGVGWMEYAMERERWREFIHSVP